MTNNIHKKRAQKIRKKLKKINSSRFRLTVFRSSRNISAQIIDDKKNETLVSATSISKKDLSLFPPAKTAYLKDSISLSGALSILSISSNTFSKSLALELSSLLKLFISDLFFIKRF